MGCAVVSGALAGLLAGASALAGQAGTLDNSFSGDGKLALDVASNVNQGDRAYGLVRLPGGDLLAVGSSPVSGDDDLALARVDSTGVPVGSFGGGDGSVTRDFAGAVDALYAVASTDGGKVVAAGTVGLGPEFDLAIARFDAATGNLDPAFNAAGPTPGLKTLDFPGDVTSEAARALAKQGSRLVVAGDLSTPHESNTLLARFKADGTVDSAFGDGGTVARDFGHGDNDSAFGVATTTSGKIVIAGTWVGASKYRMYVARFKANGKLDKSFGGGDGVALTKTAKHFAALGYGMALQDDGAIVLAGYGGGSGRNGFVAARFTRGGTLDRSFGGDGVVVTQFGNRQAYGNDVAIGPGQKIVVVGYTNVGPDQKFALARYRPNGKLDRGFGNGGKVTTELTPGTGTYDAANAVVVQPDGRPVLAGSADVDFGFARYLSH